MLEHERTTYTSLYNYWSHNHFTSLSTGDSVLYASKTDPDADDYKFHLLDRLGNPTGSTIDPVCDHSRDRINFLPVTIKMKEYLCVSCYNCRQIWLMNLETKQVTVAYTGLDVQRMCQGEANTLYTVDRIDVISVLDMSGTNFTLRKTLP